MDERHLQNQVPDSCILPIEDHHIRKLFSYQLGASTTLETRRERENQSNCSRFHYQAEGGIIVDAIPLSKTLCHNSSFVSINRAICLPFEFENPLAPGNVQTTSWWYKAPCFVLMECLMFFYHCLLLVQMLQSIFM